MSHTRLKGGILAALAAGCALAGMAGHQAARVTAQGASPATKTPIKHLVIIFGENVSFDHYFGTYPSATNASDEPAFTASPSTPSVNGLGPSLQGLCASG